MGEKYHAVFYTFIDSILIGVNWRLAQVTRSEPNKYSNSKNSQRILDPTSKYKSIQVFKYSSIQVLKYLSIQVFYAISMNSRSHHFQIFS